ncbi:hypothetical protein SY88_06540 [Clostridiales bacterium PH28_bin88]|nr:hypothetical protein SY88_06540 [Clostridiales bacterium PH28_bin88]
MLSKDYQALLAKHSMLCTMSRKGNCYENACVNLFQYAQKSEMIHLRKFQTMEVARRAIFKYIEMFYNRKRRHQNLNYMNPASFLKKKHKLSSSVNTGSFASNSQSDASRVFGIGIRSVIQM